VTHHDAGPGPDLLLTELLVVALLTAAAVYVLAARRSTRGSPPRSAAASIHGTRVGGTAWPRGRTLRWTSGVATAVVGLAVGLVGPHDLRVHVAGHLLVGMVAPLLLATAAPVTLALRTLPRPHARALGRLLRSRPVAVVAHPAVAALLDTGGMWLLFRTDLLATVPPVLVHLHMLLAGYVFAFSLVGSDPAPHRPGLGLRAAVLVATVAAHDVLAKLVYATPPPGVPAAQAEAAGLLLHYGGTPVHVVLLVLLGREWAAAQRRGRRRAEVAGYVSRRD
jgi:putative membrane protein